MDRKDAAEKLRAPQGGGTHTRTVCRSDLHVRRCRSVRAWIQANRRARHVGMVPPGAHPRRKAKEILGAGRVGGDGSATAAHASGAAIAPTPSLASSSASPSPFPGDLEEESTAGMLCPPAGPQARARGLWHEETGVCSTGSVNSRIAIAWADRAAGLGRDGALLFWPLHGCPARSATQTSQVAPVVPEIALLHMVSASRRWQR